MQSKDNNKITEGPILSNMLIYFLTLLIGASFQQFYNTVDAIIIGRVVGADGLAAVGGSAAMIVNIFLGFFVGLATGSSVIIAQYYGASRKEEVGSAVHTSIAMAIVGGIIITVIGLISSPAIITLMKTDPEIVTPSVLYLRIYFIGMVPNLIYNMGAGILRAVGDSKRPLIVLVISCFANILLDLLFVVVLGFGYISVEMGVIGVAVATILCQLLSAVIVLYILFRSNDSYKLVPGRIRFDKPMLLKIISIGLPAGLQGTMYTLSNTLIQTAINELGKNTTAAWAAYGKIDVLFWMTISSLGNALTTFAGQNYGAGKSARVRSSIRYAFIIATIITIPLSAVLYYRGELFLRIFVKEPEVIAIGTQMMIFLTPFYIGYIAVEVFSCSLRALGTSFIPMVITLSGICLLRVTWVMFVFPGSKTIETVETSYPLTWIVTSILFTIYYIYYTRKKHIYS